MTLTVQTPKIQYTGDGVQDRFSFTFTIQDDSHLVVTVDEIPQTEGIEYNLENVTEFGGDVVFVVAPADQTIILVSRETPFDQQVDYEPFSEFPAETHELSLDKLTAIIQELQGSVQAGDPSNPNLVQSVFNRIGNIIAVLGDYSASLVTYFNGVSGLFAENVQAAIDELAATAGATSVNIIILDDISSQFDGVQTVFNLFFDGTPVPIEEEQDLMSNINGLYQDPASYTVGNNQITFTEAPEATAEGFILWFQPIDALVQNMVIPGYIEVPQFKNYPIVPWGTFDHRLTGIYIVLEQGNMDVSILINNAPAAGLENLAVNTTPILIEGLALAVGGNRQIDLSVNTIENDAANLEFSVFSERILT